MKNKISAIIPLYNGENVILRALQSIINQTIQVDEIIIIDDGSSDNSFNKVNDFIKKNEYNFIRIISKKNGGASSARNKGIKLARNEILAFLDSDDEWTPNKLELQLNYINNDDVVLVGGNHFEHKITYISFHKASDINTISLNDLLFKNYFQTSTVMVKKSAILRFNCFNENQKYAEEGQFYYNISKYGKLVHINKQLVIYDGGNKSGFGQSGLSGNILEMEKGELSNIKYAYKKLHVNFFIFIASYLVSIIKFSRRYCIIKLRIK